MYLMYLKGNLGGTRDNFPHAEQLESNYGQIISVNCHQRWKLFIAKSQHVAGGQSSV
jgi:hypothetical protein